MNLGYAQYNLTARLKRLESDQATFFIREYDGIVQTKNPEHPETQYFC